MLEQQPPDIFEMFILSSVDTEVNTITKNKDLKKKNTVQLFVPELLCLPIPARLSI